MRIFSFFVPTLLVLCSVSNAAERPNILIILTDDMGFSDLGCFGGEIETPNLDRLAANGLRFTEFYNTARCWPTRATMLSGRYSNRLSPSQVTIAEVLRTAGYETVSNAFSKSRSSAFIPRFSYMWPRTAILHWLWGSVY